MRWRRLGLLGLLGLLTGACSEPPPIPAPIEETPEQAQLRAPPAKPTVVKFDVGGMPDAVAADPTLAPRLKARLTATGAQAWRGWSPRAVTEFYARREHRPAWIRGSWPTASAIATLRALDALQAHGLDPADYDDDALALGGGQPQDPVAFELRMTDVWLTVAAHLRRGRVDPSTGRPAWSVQVQGEERGELGDGLLDALEAALTDERTAEALIEQAPPDPGYTALRAAMARLVDDEVHGPWPTIPRLGPLQPGATGPAVAALRQRLARTDGLEDATGDAFDPALGAALRRFQARHGLTETGWVDARTRAALAVSLADRVAQVRANLERLRWLPHEPGPRHVRIETVAGEVVVFEGLRRTWATRMQVGTRCEPLTRRHARLTEIVVDGRGSTASSSDDPKAALGWVSVVVDGEPGLRLHGGPGPQAQDASMQRARTQGCVYLEDAPGLARALVTDPAATQRLAAALGANDPTQAPQTIALAAALPVYVRDATAYVVDGTLHLHPDVGGRDRALLAAIDRPGSQRAVATP